MELMEHFYMKQSLVSNEVESRISGYIVYNDNNVPVLEPAPKMGPDGEVFNAESETESESESEKEDVLDLDYVE